MLMHPAPDLQQMVIVQPYALPPEPLALGELARHQTHVDRRLDEMQSTHGGIFARTSADGIVGACPLHSVSSHAAALP